MFDLVISVVLGLLLFPLIREKNLPKGLVALAAIPFAVGMLLWMPAGRFLVRVLDDLTVTYWLGVSSVWHSILVGLAVGIYLVVKNQSARTALAYSQPGVPYAQPGAPYAQPPAVYQPTPPVAPVAPVSEPPAPTGRPVGWCAQCGTNVWLNADGSCSAGHPASSITNTYTVEGS